MTCANCARHVAEAIQSVPGVRSAVVSLENARATVHWSPGATENIPAILQAVQNAGYQAAELSPGGHSPAPGRLPIKWHWPLVLGLVVTTLLMAGEWGLGLMMTPWFRWLSLVLAGAVQIFSGAPFYRGAWRQLKTGRSNMDTLVALGSTTAFGYSAWALFSGAGGHLYFMEAAAIITLISLGHFLEARMSEKAGDALRALLTLAPPTARKIQRPSPGNPKPDFDWRTASLSPSEIPHPNSEREIEVPVSELKIGDEIVLRPGDRVPVDGIVVEGASAVDESSLTGESHPVDKAAGAELFAGTVNLNGRLVMRVTAIGEATALAHIIAAVQRAQSSRAAIQRLGDRVSSVFVPVVVGLALVAGIFWGIHSGAERAFVIAAAVLIVACPCAMGLATPAAIMAAANAAARRGILIRDGIALEKAGDISAIVFDKTGTLTLGRPELAAIWQAPGRESEIKPLAAALTRDSTHPISRTISRLADGAPPVSNWKEIRGCGVEAYRASALQPSTLLRLGSLPWLREGGVDLTAGEPFIAKWSAQGATVVGLAEASTLLALFAVRDAVKPHAADVLARLKENGWDLYLVTGDHAPAAAHVAQQTGIAPENVLAEARPEQKAEFVKKLQARGARVAFVGDGINDAPALAQANLGIAVSRASDIAREAADVILLKSEIEAVPEALGLAQATLRAIRQNLFWAFFYNVVGVPLAALGFLSPVFCAAAMGASDLIVIGNALRLLRWRR